MTSKGAKENLVTRLGFKSSNSVSKAEAELERLKQENAHLRRKIDDATRRHVRPPSSDKSKLLEVKRRACPVCRVEDFFLGGGGCLQNT